MDTTVTVFEIDAADRISRVDDAWLAFAEENDGPDLLRETVLGHELWEYVAGSELRLLYRALVERVRKSRRAIEAPFRCDAPAEERHMRLRIEPIGDSNSLRFASTTLRSVQRRAIRLLDQHRTATERDGNSLIICSLCKAIKREDASWMPLDRAVIDMKLTSNDSLPELSHSACPECIGHLEEAEQQARTQ